MAKGDIVHVYVGTNDQPIECTANANGRKLVTEFTKESNLWWLLVHEQTWTGRTVKTARFRADAVVAVVSNFEEA